MRVSSGNRAKSVRAYQIVLGVLIRQVYIGYIVLIWIKEGCGAYTPIRVNVNHLMSGTSQSVV